VNIAGFADDVFETVRAAGDHEVGCADEGQKPHFVVGRKFDGDSRTLWRKMTFNLYGNAVCAGDILRIWQLVCGS
jgi:hypothetical protein